MLLTRLARLAVNWQSINRAIKWAICHWRQSAASGANRKTLFARQELFFLMYLKFCLICVINLRKKDLYYKSKLI